MLQHAYIFCKYSSLKQLFLLKGGEIKQQHHHTFLYGRGRPWLSTKGAWARTLCSLQSGHYRAIKHSLFPRKTWVRLFEGKERLRTFPIHCCHYDKVNKMWMFFYHFTLFYVFVCILESFCNWACILVLLFGFSILPCILSSSVLWKNRKIWSNYRLINSLWEKAIWEIALPML